MIIVGREDGILDVWDLFDNLGTPSHQHLVSAIGIKALEMSSTKPKLLTVGDKDGCLHLLNLPTNLYTRNPNEKTYFLNFIEKEKQRVDYYKLKLHMLTQQKKNSQHQYQESDFDLKKVIFFLIFDSFYTFLIL